jgi:uncharacterized protein YjeT (DUF2065 family)
MILNRDRARVALGLIRLINGTLALLAPRKVARMFGVDPETNGAVVYVLRLFGIRTVLLGAQLLLTKDAERRQEALRAGLVIHGSDTLAAAWAGLRGDLPKKAAITGTVVSAANTALAVIAGRSEG